MSHRDEELRALQEENRELRQHNARLEAELRQAGPVEAAPQESEERARHIKRLEESEKKYQVVFNSSNDAIFIHSMGPDGTPGRFELVNDAACRRLGYSREELLSMSPLDIDDPDAASSRHEIIEDLSSSRAGAFEMVHVAKDGSRIPVEISSRFIELNGRTMVISIARDISERKRAQVLAQVRMRLLEYAPGHTLEEVLRKTLDEIGELVQSPIGFYHFVEDENTLSLQTWSTRTIEQFCKAEAHGLHYRIEDAGVWVDCIRQRRTVIHNDYASLPHRKGLPEGHAEVVRELVVPIFRDGHIVAVLGVGNKPTDYTRQDAALVEFLADVAWEIARHKRAQESIRLQASQYATILQTSQNGFWLADREGRLLDVNETYANMSGYTRDELLSMTIADLEAAEPAEKVEQHIHDVLKTGSDRFESRHRAKDGRVFDVEVSTSWWEEGEKLIVFIHDITGRKQAQALLRESEESHRATLNAIGDGVIATDAGGCITKMNPVAESLTGCTIAEAAGKPFDQVFRIVNAKTRRPVNNPVARVMATGRVVGLANHTVLINRYGREYQIADSAAPVRNDDGTTTGVVLVFRDITAEYEAAEALRRSEREKGLILNSTAEMFAFYDLDLHVQWANKASGDSVGREPEELVGMLCHEIWHQRSEPCPGCPVLEALETGQPQQGEITTPDGRCFLLRGYPVIDEKGEITGLVEFGQDITERRRYESERERLIAAIEQTGEMVVITDPEGAIQYVNPAFTRITGYTREEVLGEHVQILRKDLPDDENCSKLWQAITSGQTWEGRWENRRKDGTLYTEEAIISPVRDASGNILNYVAVKRDITEQLRLDEERAELEAQFQQAQKLESVGRLAGGVAHDLNNLLSPVLGYSEMLLDDFGPDDARREFVEEIVQAGMRARDFVRQLLAFSRKQTLEFKPIDLNDVLFRFEKLLRRTIREDVALELVPARELPLIRGDIGQLEQVIMNLSVNAQDAMPDGGTLTLETGQVELDQEYAVNHEGVEPGTYVMLAVSDTGHGMEEKVREHAFEPFYSTKGEQGTGLGLATVYGIVKQHGGSIGVHSEPGKGTRFRIYLPVSGESEVEAGSTTHAVDGKPGTGTILLVEDNDKVRRLAEAILERHGYTILSAGNGRQALYVLESHGEAVDLLVTDVVMPEMNGRDLYERVSRMFPGVKVLYMSGYTDNVVAHRGVLDEGVNYIQKPFSVQGFVMKVRDVLGQEPD
jgi:PAS domain S-box-containing protein